MYESSDIEWHHLGVCQGMNTNYFYDDYESDPLFAKVMDGICLSCPVRKMCLREGVENSEHGLWGAVFLNSGKADKARNNHKSDEVWNEIRGGLDG